MGGAPSPPPWWAIVAFSERPARVVSHQRIALTSPPLARSKRDLPIRPSAFARPVSAASLAASFWPMVFRQQPMTAPICVRVRP